VIDSFAPPRARTGAPSPCADRGATCSSCRSGRRRGAAAGRAGQAPARCRWPGRRRAPADGGGGFRNSAAEASRPRSRDTADPPQSRVAARRSYSATSPSAEKSRFAHRCLEPADRSGGGPSRRRGRRLRGRLSMASNPRSSSALIAVVRPAPDGPVTKTTRGRRGAIGLIGFGLSGHSRSRLRGLPSLSCRFRASLRPRACRAHGAASTPRIPPRMDVPRRGSTVLTSIRS
jgi:hypothetical protein